MLTGRGRRVARVVVAFGLAAGVLWLFVTGVGVGRIRAGLAGADPRPVALGAVSAVLAVLVWSEALRQALVASDGAHAGGLRFRLAFLAGDFTKQVLPMGHASGPAVMAYAVSAVLGEEYEETLAVVTVTDLLNLVASLLLATVGLVVVVGRDGTQLPALRLVVASLVVASAGVALALVLVTRRRATLVRVVHLLAGLCHRTAGRAVGRLAHLSEPAAVDRRLAGYFRTLDVVGRDRARVAAAAGLALLGWLLYATPLYLAALALDVPVTPALAVFLVPMAGLATWFPLPGGLGGVEVALAAGLVAVTGVGVGTAAAVALLYRLCAYWTVVAVDGACAASLFLGGTLATARSERERGRGE